MMVYDVTVDYITIAHVYVKAENKDEAESFVNEWLESEKEEVIEELISPRLASNFCGGLEIGYIEESDSRETIDFIVAEKGDEGR